MDASRILSGIVNEKKGFELFIDLMEIKPDCGEETNMSIFYSKIVGFPDMSQYF